MTPQHMMFYFFSRYMSRPSPMGYFQCGSFMEACHETLKKGKRRGVFVLYLIIWNMAYVLFIFIEYSICIYIVSWSCISITAYMVCVFILVSLLIIIFT